MVAVDVNPLVIEHGHPVAVDALVEVAGDRRRRGTGRTGAFDALFDPRGVIVAGASSHPGKFGFVVLHNLLATGTPVGCSPPTATRPRGRRAARAARAGVRRGRARRRRRPRVRVHAGRAQRRVLRTLCGPGRAGRVRHDRRVRRDRRRRAGGRGGARRGRRGARPAPRRARTARASCRPRRRCARRWWRPTRPRGASRVASQSGNIVSSVENLARHSGVGVSRAMSVGNAAAVGVADFLEYFADDPATAVSIAYLEGIDDGRRLFERLRAVTRAGPWCWSRGRHARRRTCRRVAHRRARDRRPRVHRRVPAGGRHPRRDRRRGVRRRRHARHPAAPARPRTRSCSPPPADGACSRPTPSPGRSCACSSSRPTCARPSTPSSRRGGAGPTRSTSRRPRRATPSPRCSSSSPIIRRCINVIVPRPRRAVEPGPHAPGRRVRRRRRASSASRRSTSARTSATPRSPPRSPPPPARRSLCASELAVSDPDNPGPRAVRAPGRYCMPSRPRAVRALEHVWGYAPRHRARRAPHDDRPPLDRRRARDRRRRRTGARVHRRPVSQRRRTGRARCDSHLVGPARAAADRRRGRRPAPADRARPRGGRAATCFMVEDDGAFVAGGNVDMPLVPASTQKLSSPLRRSTRSPRTSPSRPRLLAPGAPEQGVVERLCFVGSGDPVMATDEYVAFVDQQAGARPPCTPTSSSSPTRS